MGWASSGCSAMWMRALGRSFSHAWCGIVRTVREERNFRIHLTALCYVVAAGLLAGLDGARWAAVLLCCGGILVAELFNTALEHLCDGVCSAHHPAIGAAKDAAAGAVLVLAIISLWVAVVIFAPWVLRGELIVAIGTHVWVVPVFLLSLPCAILWIRGSKK